jgi:hypothetical protein
MKKETTPPTIDVNLLIEIKEALIEDREEYRGGFFKTPKKNRHYTLCYYANNIGCIKEFKNYIDFYNKDLKKYTFYREESPLKSSSFCYHWKTWDFKSRLAWLDKHIKLNSAVNSKPF